ncbi:MAG: hypothetical protein INR66_22625 [Gordonia polyisoprenivorans]|nr:hypothetical protein [Gordonia polyisoprenivorans]
MSVADFARLPTGTHQWRELIEHVRSAYADDRLETNYLELKSGVDLNTKAGRHKVAKFVLGAANRAPETASRYFGGHAVMLLGIAPPEIEGVPAFEDHEVRQEVSKFVNEPGPMWDLVRTAVDGRDVIAVVVDPPQPGHVWACMVDGVGLSTGVLYVRPSGQTRPARGAEVHTMLARVTGAEIPTDIGVRVEGCVWSVSFDVNRVRAVIAERADQLRAIQDKPARRSSDYYHLGITSADFGRLERSETRSRQSYEREIDDWERRLTGRIGGIANKVVAELDPIRVVTTNHSDRWLSDVELTLTLQPGLRHQTHDRQAVTNYMRELPDAPRPWGPSAVTVPVQMSKRVSVGASVPQLGAGLSAPRISGGVESELTITAEIGDLRPQRVSDRPRRIVLFAQQDGESHHGRWEITARDIDGVIRGELADPIATAHRDITSSVLEHVRTALIAGQ